MALAVLALVASTAFVGWRAADGAPSAPAPEAPAPAVPAIPVVDVDADRRVEAELYALDHTVVPPAPEPAPEPEPEPAPAPPPAPRPRRTTAATSEPAPAAPAPPPAIVSGMPGLDRVNGFRAANGVGPLGWDGTLAATAADWSAHMAAVGAISHRGNLFDGTSGCRRVAENVAYAGSLDRALGLLEESPGHRSNLLNGSYDRVGIGVVESGGRVYVTQIFCG